MGTTIGILLRGKLSLRSRKDHNCIPEDLNLRTLLVGESIDKDGKGRRPHRHMGIICRIFPKRVLSLQVPRTSVQEVAAAKAAERPVHTKLHGRVLLNHC